MNKIRYTATVFFVGIAASSFAFGGESRQGPKTFESMDKNKDGKIVASEVGDAEWSRIKAADANGDSVVTRSEFDAWVVSMRGRSPGGPPPTFEQMDKNKDGKIVASEVTPEQWRDLVRADANKDNAVTKAEIEAFMVSMMGARGRRGPWGHGGPGRVLPSFEAMDKNSDGKIVESEVAAEQWQFLVRSDTNKDKVVTKAEWEASLAANQGRRHHGPPPTFEEMDKNKDGKVVPSEVSADVWRRLVFADTNKDNVVTRAEWEAMKAKRTQRGVRDGTKKPSGT